LYIFLIAPMRATCPAISFSLITLTIFREAYKLWNSLLCSFSDLSFRNEPVFYSEELFTHPPTPKP
jgi:hypothetical protein